MSDGEASDCGLTGPLAAFLGGEPDPGDVHVYDAPTAPNADDGQPVRIDQVLPSLNDIPIPEVVKVERRWPASMREMADHIGARATLLIVDAFGGQRVTIPPRGQGSPFRHLIGLEAANKIAWLYGGQRFQVPVAKGIVSRVRRAGVVAAARQRLITIGDAARIIGTSRNYLSDLVNGTREGWDATPVDLESLRGEVLLKRTASKLVGQLCAAGVASPTITAIWTSIFVAVGSTQHIPVGGPSNVVLLKRVAEAVVAELSAFDIDPDAVDAACGAVLSLLDMEAASDAP